MQRFFKPIATLAYFCFFMFVCSVALAEEDHIFEADISLYAVKPFRGSYWHDDSDINDCCRPGSSGVADLIYQMTDTWGLLTELTIDEGFGLIDPGVGLTWTPLIGSDTGRSERGRHWSLSSYLLLSLPMAEDSTQKDLITAITGEIKPSYRRGRWHASVELVGTQAIYSSEFSSSSTAYDSRLISSASAEESLEYAWSPVVSTFIRLKNAVITYEPSHTIFLTDMGCPGLKWRAKGIDWIFELRESNSSDRMDEPQNVLLKPQVLSLVAGLNWSSN